MATREYTVVIEPNGDEPGFTATVPALSGCVSAGDSVDETLENARDAIELWISMAAKKGEPLPDDFTVITKIQIAA